MRGSAPGPRLGACRAGVALRVGSDGAVRGGPIAVGARRGGGRGAQARGDAGEGRVGWRRPTRVRFGYASSELRSVAAYNLSLTVGRTAYRQPGPRSPPDTRLRDTDARQGTGVHGDNGADASSEAVRLKVEGQRGNLRQNRRRRSQSGVEGECSLADVENEFEPKERLHPTFFGRAREMEWLFDRFRRRGELIIITGVAGAGKTTLANQFIGSVKTSHPPLVWTIRHPPDEAMAEISARVEELYRDRNVPEIILIDEAEALREGELNEITKRVLNFKAVRMLIFVSRFAPKISRAEVLRLNPLDVADAAEMLRDLLGDELSRDDLTAIIDAAGGLPLALRLLAGQLRGRAPEDVVRILRGEIYKLDRQIIVPERTLITEVKPRIMMVNEALVERLRLHPQAIYDLPSRKFEELVAELLVDLGYEVELTPATRDGGKDILAYMTTPHGKLLCLVEAKRFRRDRTVGVELVRQLFGTLADAEANSAMMVTTSRFSPDAKSFQQRHQYRLALRDYGNIVEWIGGYRQR